MPAISLNARKGPPAITANAPNGKSAFDYSFFAQASVTVFTARTVKSGDAA